MFEFNTSTLIICLLLLCTTMINNIKSKRESRDTDLTWFDNVPKFTKRQLYFTIHNSELHYNIYIRKTLNPITTFTPLPSTWLSISVNMRHYFQ